MDVFLIKYEIIEYFLYNLRIKIVSTINILIGILLKTGLPNFHSKEVIFNVHHKIIY